MTAREATLLRGTCHVQLAFDIGFDVAVDRAAQRLGAPHDVPAHRRGGGQPTSLKPLRVARAVATVPVGGMATGPQAEVSIYDFGALCVTCRLPFAAAVDELAAISAALYEHPGLAAAARECAAGVLAELGDAVREPRLSDMVEDYVVYHLPAADADALLAAAPAAVARTLRAEPAALSPQETRSALASRIAYAPGEAVVVDWFAALAVGPNMDDERRVLEVANVELLELRLLEARIDAAIHDAYALLHGTGRARMRIRGHARDLARLARLQADNAVMHEGIDNPLKLFGDDYLARLYRLATARFHVPHWDASLARKLATVERIYGKLADQVAQRRAELLETIIILLIAVELAVNLVP